MVAVDVVVVVVVALHRFYFLKPILQK